MAMSKLESGGVPCGFPDAMIMQSTMSERLRCAAGGNLLRDPYQNACGCRFCKRCLDYWKPKNIPCPICVNDGAGDDPSIILGQAGCYPDMAARKEIGYVKVKCPNRGCDWTGDCKGFDSHENACAFKNELCTCGDYVLVRDMMQHRRTTCAMRSATCDLCRRDVPCGDLTLHRVSCAQSEVQCELCDRKGIKRKDLASHQKPGNPECPRKREKCPYSCGHLAAMHDMQRHKEEHVAKHLDLLHQEVRTLLSQESTQQISAMEQQLQEVVRTIGAAGLGQGSFANAQGGGATSSDHDVEISALMDKNRVINLEGIVEVLGKQIEKCLTKQAARDDELRLAKRTIASLEEKVRAQDQTNQMKDAVIAEMSLRIETLECTSYDGTYLWKITDFSRKRQDAISGRVTSIYSPAFFTSRQGYKMCARIYLNGDGMGRGSHVSLFFLLMRGRQDALLAWPFRQRVSFMILDQGRNSHIMDAFRPDPTSSSFKRPTSQMNIASGCPLFADLNVLQDPNKKYIVDDTMFVKVVVDCSDL